MSAESDPASVLARLAGERSRSPLSLIDLLKGASYTRFRREVTAHELADYLRRHPELVEEWLRYSEDKRTSDGWYFGTNGRRSWIGQVGPTMPEYFDAPETACAEYILRELDSMGRWPL